jgi:hypothetical protein
VLRFVWIGSIGPEDVFFVSELSSLLSDPLEGVCVGLADVESAGLHCQGSRPHARGCVGHDDAYLLGTNHPAGQLASPALGAILAMPMPRLRASKKAGPQPDGLRIEETSWLRVGGMVGGNDHGRHYCGPRPSYPIPQGPRNPAQNKACSTPENLACGDGWTVVGSGRGTALAGEAPITGWPESRPARAKWRGEK